MRRIFRPGEENEVIGAEVEHGWGWTEGAGTGTPARLGSAVVGLAGGLLQPVIITARRMIGAGEVTLPANRRA